MSVTGFDFNLTAYTILSMLGLVDYNWGYHKDFFFLKE